MNKAPAVWYRCPVARFATRCRPADDQHIGSARAGDGHVFLRRKIWQAPAHHKAASCARWWSICFAGSAVGNLWAIQHWRILELLTYNALPATAARYVGAAIRPAGEPGTVRVDDRAYTSNGPDLNIYGLEPHWLLHPNHGQGWPKFAAHPWMRAADGGLAVRPMRRATSQPRSMARPSASR